MSHIQGLNFMISHRNMQTLIGHFIKKHQDQKFCAVCDNVSVVIIEVTSMYYYMSLKYLLTCSEVRVI